MKKWGLLALGAFLVLDALLVVFVMRQQDSATLASNDGDSVAVSASPKPEKSEETEEPQEKEEPEEEPEPTVDPEDTLLLSIARDDSMTRVTRGSCDDSGVAKFEYSGNGGKDFDERPAPTDQILAVELESDGLVTVVGTTSDCTVVSFQSDDGGQAWYQVAKPDVWHLGPEGQDSVVSPARTSKPGCDVLSLQATDDLLARVTCTNGDIVGSGDGGDKWNELGKLDDVRAAVFPAPGNGLALAAYQGCAAQTFTTRDGGREWDMAECLPGDKAEALAFNGATLVAQVSGDVYLSTDKGANWDQP